MDDDFEGVVSGEKGLRSVFSHISYIPLFFLGLGIYRAWIELAYVRPLTDYPAWEIAGHDVYDASMIITLLVMAAFARRIVPLLERKWALWAAGITMTLATLLIVISYYVPSIAYLIAYPSALLAGFGTAFIILLWSELYGCLNPVRVALYYSGSLLVGVFLIFIIKGFIQEYMFGATLLLPAFSLLCVVKSYRILPAMNRPKSIWGKFSFPWKPVLLMAVYGFAFGLRENQLYLSYGPHSSWATALAAAIVFFGVLSFSKRFNFSIIYRVALPLMVSGFLLIPSVFPASSQISNACVVMSYTSFSILIMLILSNLSYRWGIGAVWLFGIERALRALFMLAGRETAKFLGTTNLSNVAQTTTLTTIVVVLVVVATMILLSEKELTSKWGITFLGAAGTASESAWITERNRLSSLCEEIGRKYNLSHRENEVLFLLAQKKTLADIEKELFIARGTVKAHTGHIYDKLNVHNRGELYEALGIVED